MLIELSKLVGMPVGSLNEGAFVGSVRQTVISPGDAKLIGFTIKIGSIFSKILVVSFQDVVDIDQGGVVINSRDNLVEKEEIVRVGEILKHKFNLIGLKAVSKDKQNLGRVQDAVVETQSGDILRLYTSRMYQNRVFERSKIDKITWREVVLNCESEEKAKEKATVPEAELA